MLFCVQTFSEYLQMLIGPSLATTQRPNKDEWTNRM